MSSAGQDRPLLVVALGGNALQRPGQSLTAAAQRAAVRRTAGTLADAAAEWRLVVSHGNGPQVGMLARGEGTHGAYPLDVLDAETEGMIGYLIQQELGAALPERSLVTVLTQVEVDPDDPAFEAPSKPVGPPYGAAQARRLAEERGWTMEARGEACRRLVPSPLPRRVTEIDVIRLLVGAGVVVICGGGGGIPVVSGAHGGLSGVEAVVDKDRVTALVARELGARQLLLLTDVEAVWEGWGTDRGRAIREANPAAMAALELERGTMGPKVAAACELVTATGAEAAIGALGSAAAVLAGEAGTRIRNEVPATRYW